MEKEALTELQDVLLPALLDSWDSFGQQIGVPADVISQIRRKIIPIRPKWLYKLLGLFRSFPASRNEVGFKETLEWWVTNHHNPTYEAIIAVLRNKTLLSSRVKELLVKKQGKVHVR